MQGKFADAVQADDGPRMTFPYTCLSVPAGHLPVPAGPGRLILPIMALGLLVLLALPAQPASAQSVGAGSIIVQSTTSTQNAGFYDHVVPPFTAATGIEVRVVAVGTGQALKNAQNCDGDLLIVHAREAEDNFIIAGYGAARHDLMYNDFIIVGPQHDPAGLRHAGDVREAMRRIERSQSRFASRGDESGTHKKEQALWATINRTPKALTGRWYFETGNGMGATLNFAVQSNSYVLTDRATWLTFANKYQHQILFEGDSQLFNQYGIVLLDRDHCPKARHDAAARFAEWLLSPAGQDRIASLTRKGERLFTPNAKLRPNATPRPKVSAPQ